MEFKDYNINLDEEKENYYAIDFTLFIISFAIVLSKTFIGYWSWLPSLFNALSSTITTLACKLIDIVLQVWLMSDHYIYAFIIGIMMSFVTWQIMYLDSDVPGVVPPTPFTYNQYYQQESFSGFNKMLKRRTMPKYHLNYIFAMAVAPLTTLALIICNY